MQQRLTKATISPAEWEMQFNPRAATPDFEAHGAALAPYNAAAFAELNCHRDVRFGEHPLRSLDIFPAATANAPVHVFIHGGYWRGQDKANFAFTAGALVPLGITTVVMNYELCPDTDLDGVTASALDGFEWIAAHIADYGGDAGNISISGHSAGAHLAAEIMAHGYSTKHSLTGAVMISGVFDPAPAAATTVNEVLDLSAATIERRNVLLRPVLMQPETTLVAGGAEPELWVDQSVDYYHHLRRQGMHPSLHVLPGLNHFNVLGLYLDANGPVIRAIRSAAVVD